MTKTNGQPEHLYPPLTLALLPAWQAGIKDSVNPGALTGLLVCGFLLWLILNKGWPLKMTVVPFFAGIAFLAMGSALGAFDAMITTKAMDVFHDVAYFVLALGSILSGLVLVRDWWTVKRSGDRAATVVKFHIARNGKRSRKASAKSLGQGGLLVAGFFIGGVLMGFIETAWAPDVYSAEMTRDLLLAGGTLTAVMDFLSYGVGYIFPLMILGVLGLAARKNGSLSRFIQDHLTVVQISLSGVLLAYGFTVIFRYYI